MGCVRLVHPSQRVEGFSYFVVVFPGHRDEFRIGRTPVSKRMIYFFLCSKDS